ncbi:MAG: hypothetical protein HFI21_17165 [Lachnospiraceae bacterium]|nr:hypothetical protein [Lachnospiraceae bacterium]
MIRGLLRQFPLLYSVVRMFHLMLEWIIKLPSRYKNGRYIKNDLEKTYSINCKTIWYFCIPMHQNLGDYAQYFCIKRWLESNYPNYNLIEIPSEPLHYDMCGLLKSIEKRIETEDMVVFQSGYTSTDLHIDEAVHRKAAKVFKNKIILFPQTVNYSTKRQLTKTAEIYNAHGRILFLARDRQSYNIAKGAFKDIKIQMYPDIVTSLIGVYCTSNKNRQGIVMCMRNDSEKLYTDAALKLLNEELNAYKITWLDTTLVKGEKCSVEIFKRYIDAFSKAQVIVTDRFHGTIFSLIAGTPVVVLKTVDHKVWEGAEWFTGVYSEYIRKADTLLDIPPFIEELMNQSKDYKLSPYFEEQYYSKLSILINEL